MALYPAAQQRPWHPYTPERFIVPTLVIVHTNAVNSEDPGSTGGLTWHFQIGEHGTVYQHRDTTTRAAANADANGFAISIETWDGGDPEGNPWSAQQLDALVALIGWCCDVHQIPRRLPDRWDGPGVGYHRLFSQWNQPVHSCPGDTRAAQFPDLLLRLAAPPPKPPQEDDVTPATTYADSAVWYFVKGLDGAIWANKGGAETEWFSIGHPDTGPLTSGPDATVQPDGRVVVCARGPGDHLWVRSRDPQPPGMNPATGWTVWWNAGSQS